jgi:hypothetical protein
VCSPCLRTNIEVTAHHGSMLARDHSEIKKAFESTGLYGVAEHLGSTPEDAVDALLNSQLLPFVSQRRRTVLRRLATLRDQSHSAAGETLHLSRWTVATYRRQLGVDRTA